jgi:8-oxo-dGTP diphosphatase
MKHVATSTGTSRRVVLAAGGVVWNHSPDGSLVALVSRVKYGDWTLPKGKLKRGETFEQASLREVREETGCVPRIRNFVGLAHYVTGRGPKVVLFWNMEYAGRPRRRSNAEIAEVVWLTPRRALRRMSYASDRTILRAAVKSLR